MRSSLALIAALAVPAVASAQTDDPNAQQPQQYDPQYQQQPQQYDPNAQQPQQYDPQYAQQPPQQYDPQYGAQQPPEQYGQAVDPAAAQYGVGYGGPHPIPYQYGSGFCYIQGAHTHEYAPFDQHLFREYNGYYYFNGDPVDFGYNQGVTWFNGNHPVPAVYGAGFCYMTWPHRHFYNAVGIAGFSLIGNYYTYAGIWPPEYYRGRNFYWGYYGHYYRSNYYGNRYYTMRPPAVYAHFAPVRVAAPAGRTFAVGAMPRAVRAPAYVGARPVAAPAYRSPGFAPGGGYRPAVAAPGYHPVAAPGYRPVAAPGYRPAAVAAPNPGYRPAAPPAAYRPASRPAAPARPVAAPRGGHR